MIPGSVFFCFYITIGFFEPEQDLTRRSGEIELTSPPERSVVRHAQRVQDPRFGVPCGVQPGNPDSQSVWGD